MLRVGLVAAPPSTGAVAGPRGVDEVFTLAGEAVGEVLAWAGEAGAAGALAVPEGRPAQGALEAAFRTLAELVPHAVIVPKAGTAGPSVHVPPTFGAASPIAVSKDHSSDIRD